MYEQVLLSLAFLIVPAIVAGVIWRGRLPVCWMFLLFLVVVLLTDLLPTLWPERFYTKSFWLVRESLHNGLRFAVALELAYHTFRAFPGARSTARALVLLLVAISLSVVLSATWAMPTVPEFSEIFTELQPRLLFGTVWLVTGIAALILWYRLPVDPMHKAILVGWVPYLLVFALGLKFLADFGWDKWLPALNAINATAYFLLLVYWTRAAWAPAGVQARAPAPLAVPAGQTG